MARIDRRSFIAGSAAGVAAATLPVEGLAATAEELLGEASISNRALRALRSAVRGPVMTRRSRGYATTRLVYNERFDGVRPQAVVEPLNARDVQAVVRWAQRFDVRVVAKAGGHSYAGYSTIGNGVVVDLRRIAGVRPHSRNTRANVGAGAQLIDVYSALSRRGVTVPAGSCPSVGVGGHALGGGMGLAGRRFGLLSDNMTALTIVTADGQIRRVDRNDDPDLFWACRGGGGGNFGIVTGFQFRTHRARRAAWFNVTWPWEAASAALDEWQRLLPGATDRLTAIFHLTTDSEGPPTVSCDGQFFGSESQLRATIAPLLRHGAQLSIGTEAYLPLMLRWAGCFGEPLSACHTVHTSRRGTLPRAAFYAKSDYVDEPLSAAGRETAIDWIERRNANPSLGSGALLLDSYGGALNRPKPGATAFVHRDELFCIQYGAYFEGNAAKRASQRWISGAHRAMRPYVSGQAYQNYIDAGLKGWQRAYYSTNLPRLRQVKQTYDPDFFFRFRQAIPPAG
ncbi:MAG: FAD-binding oxidoreductase [Solirubrobacterales bacterium]|nr:FAD-binding oxidoreductase [Solirubrobacterales bacterium]